MSRGGNRALAMLIAGAGVLAGCVSPTQTVSDASTGSGGAPATRTLSFIDGNSVDLGTVAGGSTTLVRLSIATTGTGDATLSSTTNSDSRFTWNGGTFPGTGGSCAQPIQGNCAVAILFTAPAGIGLYSDVVTIGYDTGAGSAQISITLSATVTVAPALAINGGVPYAFGTKNVGSSTDASLTVTNLGGIGASSLAFSGLAAPMTFKGGSYPGTGGTCSTFLASGASCTVVVTYAPTTAATTTKTLRADYSDGTTATYSATTALSGTAIGLASIAITTPATNPYDFGNVTLGATAPSVTVTLSNTGGQAALSLANFGLSAPITFKGGTYPGTGGNCGATLAASSTCTMVVSFTPTTTTLVSRTLALSYDDGSGTTHNLAQIFQGTGQNPASLLVSDGATYDFGSHVTNSVTSKTFTVSNAAGGAGATAMSGAALAAPYSYKGGAYPGTAGTCGATLAAGATCMIVVDFTPTAAGTFNRTLTVNYNNGVGATTATRPMTGVGTLPPASLTITTPAANPYDYGTVLVGASADLTVTLSNGGGQSASALSATGIAAPFAFKGGSYPGTGGDCGASLAAAATCTMIVTFAPTAAGYSTRTLSVSYSDGAGNTPSVTRPIEGTGQLPAALTISDGATYDFGSQVIATSTAHLFTVANGGGATATAMSGAALAAPFAYKGGSYPGANGTCGASLAGSATCTIELAYAPIAAVTSTGTLTVNYNTGLAATTATRALTGTGLNAPASLSITTPVADPYDYGTVTIGTAEVDLSITVSNSGGQAATSLAGNGLYAPFDFKDGAYPGTGGTCGASLAASSTCTLVVAFLPTSPGVYANTLELSYDDGTATTIHLTHALRGTGGNAALLSISDGATYDFGAHAPSTSTDYTFTVTNAGGSSATAISATALGAPFAFKGGAYPGTGGSCAATLGGAATCTIVVTFAPSAPGAYTDTLALGYSNGVSTVNTSRGLSGTGGTVANLSISDGATYDFGAVVKGYSATKLFTVTNVGQSAATSLAGSALSAPYGYAGGTYPGTGGSCGTTLAASGTCTVAITFSPTAAVAANATFTLSYHDSVTNTSSSRGMTAKGATVSAIAGGASHTCALYSTGIVRCWGSNAYGQLGDASNTDSGAPVLVGGITGATGLASGANHACALVGGKVYCWGRDNNGQLGNDVALSDANAPVQVASYTDFTQIAAGGDVTCGLRSGQTIVCWGDDSEGANGNDASFTDNATPVTVSGLTTMADVSVGRGHACGARTSGFFRCWGADAFGQNGDNASANNPTPVSPGGVNTSLSSAAGGDTTCALMSDGSAKCWGADDHGQLGNGGANTSVDTPVTVANLAGVTSLKFGLKHGCAIDSGANVVCFGRDHVGQVGDDAAYADRSSPTSVAGMSSATVLGVGENHACAARTTGLLYCWGADDSGQLGDLGSANQPTPVLVQGL